MLERFKLQLISSLLLAAALGLSGCGHDLDSKPAADQSLITLRISQGALVEAVQEDVAFRNLLNIPDAIEEGNVPAPRAWHKTNCNYKQVISVRVDNCAELDLLEFVVYNELDSQNRPKDYRYFTICGAGTEKGCGAPLTVPAETLHNLADPNVNKFAFSGICIDENRLNARSFIVFLEKA